MNGSYYFWYGTVLGTVAEAWVKPLLNVAQYEFIYTYLAFGKSAYDMYKTDANIDDALLHIMDLLFHSSRVRLK